jgi:hypothetical protein
MLRSMWFKWAVRIVLLILVVLALLSIPQPGGF